MPWKYVSFAFVMLLFWHIIWCIKIGLIPPSLKHHGNELSINYAQIEEAPYSPAKYM